MNITLEKGDIKIDIYELIRETDDETKKQVIKSFATDDAVIRHTIDYICGDDEDGWYPGDAANLRQELLGRVEAKQLETMPEYGWRVWDEIRQKIKDIRSAEHIYWVLYHKLSDGLRRSVFKELDAMGVESNYTQAQGNDDIEAIRKLIKTAIKPTHETEPV